VPKKNNIFRYGRPAYVGPDGPGTAGSKYRYGEDGSVVGAGNKPCPKCGKYPKDFGGHDPCIANLPGVWRACCGHGVKKGIVKFIDGTVIKGYFHSITKGPPPSAIKLERIENIRLGNISKIQEGNSNDS